MWISEPMPVTTRSIKAESGSTRSEKSALKAPDVIQVKTVWTIARDSSGRPASWTTDTSATANEATIAATATRPDTDFESRRPAAALIRNPMNGKSGISSSMVAALPLQRREGVRIERLAMPEQRDHDGQADGGFGRRHRHHEKDDDLPFDGAERAPERHEREVHRVQHDLDRQQDRNQVAADEHAGGADREEDRRQNQGLVERHHYRGSPRRARTTAPIIATRNQIDGTSNGKAENGKNVRPISPPAPNPPP